MEMKKQLHVYDCAPHVRTVEINRSHPQEKSDKYSIGMARINQLYMSDRQPSIFRM